MGEKRLWSQTWLPYFLGWSGEETLETFTFATMNCVLGHKFSYLVELYIKQPLFWPNVSHTVLVCIMFFGEADIRFQLILYSQTLVLSSWQRSGENLAKNRQKDKIAIAGLWKSWGALVSFHLDSWEETGSSPWWNLFLCLLRCCSMSSSPSMWSWTWWPAARGPRSCSAWRVTAPPPPPGPTLSTSWSPARCPASCDWTKARSCRPSQARPSDSTLWAIPQPRLTSSASLKSTKAWNPFTKTHLRTTHLFLCGWDF